MPLAVDVLIQSFLRAMVCNNMIAPIFLFECDFTANRAGEVLWCVDKVLVVILFVFVLLLVWIAPCVILSSVFTRHVSFVDILATNAKVAVAALIPLIHNLVGIRAMLRPRWTVILH